MIRKDLVVGEQYAYHWTKHATPQRVLLVSLEATYKGVTGYYKRRGRGGQGGVPGVAVRVVGGAQDGQEIITRAINLSRPWDLYEKAKAEAAVESQRRVEREAGVRGRFDRIQARLKKLGIDVYRQDGARGVWVRIKVEDLEKLVEAYEVEQAKWQ